MFAARSLLNLSHAAVANLEFHELASLVYRDDLRVKHDPRVRLQQELELGKKPKPKPKPSELPDHHPDIMAVIIIEHLIAVPRRRSEVQSSDICFHGLV
jgi:hypothetical protein